MTTEAKSVETEKKGGFGKAFLKFVMYGGWLVLVVIALGIYIAITVATAPK